MTVAPERLRRWREKPVTFVREQFGIEPDAWQAEALQAFADPTIPRISLQACAGPGKSALLAWCGWHFIACQGEAHDHPKGFVTAVTADNLKANIWPEFAKWQQRSPFLLEAFHCGAERIVSTDAAASATWFLGARTWPKGANPEELGKTLSGLHGGYVLALIDESGAIPPAVLRAAEQALSTRPKFGKIVQAGNPLSLDGMLYAAANELAHLWHVIRITGDPDDPKRSPRIDIEWAREQIRTYGRDNPWVKAYILGQFPPSSLNSLLGPDEVREAMGRHLKASEYADFARILGVDVATEGDDSSVVFPRQGRVAFEPTVMRNVNSTHGAGAVARKWNDWQADACFIDNTGGFGGGWLDRLREMQFAPIGVHFSGSPNDNRYANKRAEMWFEMAQWVKEGGCLPNIPALVPELTTPTYTFKGDRVIIEDKKLIKVRLGRSPDIADALALTFASPVAKRTPLQEVAAKHSRGTRREWDPYAGM